MKRGLAFVVMFLLCLGLSLALVQITHDKVEDMNLVDVVVAAAEGLEGDTLDKAIMAVLDEYIMFFRMVVVLVITLLLFNSFMVFYLVSESLDKDEKGKK